MSPVTRSEGEAPPARRLQRRAQTQSPAPPACCACGRCADSAPQRRSPRAPASSRSAAAMAMAALNALPAVSASPARCPRPPSSAPRRQCARSPASAAPARSALAARPGASAGCGRGAVRAVGRRAAATRIPTGRRRRRPVVGSAAALLRRGGRLRREDMEHAARCGRRAALVRAGLRRQRALRCRRSLDVPAVQGGDRCVLHTSPASASASRCRASWMRCCAATPPLRWSTPAVASAACTPLPRLATGRCVSASRRRPSSARSCRTRSCVPHSNPSRRCRRCKKSAAEWPLPAKAPPVRLPRPRSQERLRRQAGQERILREQGHHQRRWSQRFAQEEGRLRLQVSAAAQGGAAFRPSRPTVPPAHPGGSRASALLLLCARSSPVQAAAHHRGRHQSLHLHAESPVLSLLPSIPLRLSQTTILSSCSCCRPSASSSAAQLRALAFLRERCAAFVLTARTWATHHSPTCDISPSVLDLLAASSPSRLPAGSLVPLPPPRRPRSLLQDSLLQGALAGSPSFAPFDFCFLFRRHGGRAAHRCARLAAAATSNIVPLLNVLPPDGGCPVHRSRVAGSAALQYGGADMDFLQPLRRPRVAGSRTEYVRLVARMAALGMLGFTRLPRPSTACSQSARTRSPIASSSTRSPPIAASSTRRTWRCRAPRISCKCACLRGATHVRRQDGPVRLSTIIWACPSGCSRIWRCRRSRLRSSPRAACRRVRPFPCASRCPWASRTRSSWRSRRTSMCVYTSGALAARAQSAAASPRPSSRRSRPARHRHRPPRRAPQWQRRCGCPPAPAAAPRAACTRPLSFRSAFMRRRSSSRAAASASPVGTKLACSAATKAAHEANGVAPAARACCSRPRHQRSTWRSQCRDASAMRRAASASARPSWRNRRSTSNSQSARACCPAPLPRTAAAAAAPAADAAERSGAGSGCAACCCPCCCCCAACCACRASMRSCICCTAACAARSCSASGSPASPAPAAASCREAEADRMVAFLWLMAESVAPALRSAPAAVRPHSAGVLTLLRRGCRGARLDRELPKPMQHRLS